MMRYYFSPFKPVLQSDLKYRRTIKSAGCCDQEQIRNSFPAGWQSLDLYPWCVLCSRRYFG